MGLFFKSSVIHCNRGQLSFNPKMSFQAASFNQPLPNATGFGSEVSTAVLPARKYLKKGGVKRGGGEKGRGKGREKKEKKGEREYY